MYLSPYRGRDNGEGHDERLLLEERDGAVPVAPERHPAPPPLQLDDLRDCHFFISYLRPRAVGSDVALLRSVAVVGAEEGRGVGEALVRRTLSTAAAQGVREVYLLTTTAAGYFPRFGFQVVERSALPAALEASTELRGACPASATAMRLTLEGGPRG